MKGIVDGLIDEFSNEFDRIHKEIITTRAEYIEMMAGAYLKATCLSPHDVVLVEEYHDNIIGWRFITREEWEKMREKMRESNIMWDDGGKVWGKT